MKWLKEYKYIILIISVILFISLYSYFTKGVLHSVVNSDSETLINFINSFGLLAIAVFIILVIIEVVVAPIPSVVLYAVGGIIFGTFWGGTAALIGNIIGAIIAFQIARIYGRKHIEKGIKKDKLKKFDSFTKKYGVYTIFLLRINPFTSSDVFSYLAGLTKMPIKHLIIGTALGLLPLVYIQSYIGDSFIKNNPIIYLLFIVASIAYVAIFFYGIYHFRKKS